MKFLFDIIKGAFIGVANIIPGVSGGTMAVSMGVYDKLIEAINKLTKEFKKSFLIFNGNRWVFSDFQLKNKIIS